MPFLDRAIPAEVAEQLAVPLAEAETRDEALAGFFERLLGTFVMMGGMYGGAILPVARDPRRGGVPRGDRADHPPPRASPGRGVILGRAGMLVLADHPHVVRVRLSGPLEARIEQAMRRYGALARGGAHARSARTTARAPRGCSASTAATSTDPSLYDLVINATRFGVDECVALIVAAAASPEVPRRAQVVISARVRRPSSRPRGVAPRPAAGG